MVKDIWGRTYTFYCAYLNNGTLSSSMEDVQHYMRFAEEITITLDLEYVNKTCEHLWETTAIITPGTVCSLKCK